MGWLVRQGERGPARVGGAGQTAGEGRQPCPAGLCAQGRGHTDGRMQGALHRTCSCRGGTRMPSRNRLQGLTCRCRCCSERALGAVRVPLAPALSLL